MKSFWLAFAFLPLLAILATGKESEPTHFVPPDAIDLVQLLGAPPAEGSPETLSEIKHMLDLQAARTPADIARGQKEAPVNITIFAEVLGPKFNAENLPVTFKLMNEVSHDAGTISEKAKKIWNRPRPFKQDVRLQPPIDRPDNASYPSGHTTMSLCWALILAELAPDYRKDLLSRANIIAQDRIQMGVHFPSDIAGGKKLGAELARLFLANPDFQARLGAAKAEVQARLL